MSTSTAPTFKQDLSRHAWFIAFVAISGIVFHHALSALYQYSQQEDSASHTVLIPVIVLFLLYTERRRIFSIARTQAVGGIAVIAIGLLVYWLGIRTSSQASGSFSLSIQILAIVILWSGGFLVCYGFATARAAAFSLLFLLLMVPLPDVILDKVIYWLQAGSTELTYLIFQLVGTPVVRNGFLLSVPGVTIEVAKECSSIRSSIALLITCLLAAHLYLRTTWRMALFVVLAMAVSILKNGIRIATLTLLSVYVDPGFLTGKLHRQGGFVFFLLALAILFPILLWLQKTEHNAAPPAGKLEPELDPALIRES
jgi:exosortase